jgi:phthiodiolone/phenolphthiodiolone dimycocerosates ketoreductase
VTTKRPVETALYFWNHRSIPPKTVVPFVQMIEMSGVVDHFWMWDVVAGWFPPDLWTEEFTPLAAFGDFDSVYDGFITAGLAASATDKLGILIGGTNALRHGPAEHMQRAMTLADSTAGGCILCVGAGEAYNTIPFGYDRKLSVARMEDMFQIFRKLWETDGPIDFDGRVIKFDQAYIGNVRGRRPSFWAMGAGPRLIKLAGSYADGWMSVAPNGITSPEAYAQRVKEIKQYVEQQGRDPEQFRFGLTPTLLIHEDPDIVDRVFDNNVIKFFASIFGRLNQGDWAELGIESPFPADWNYSLKFLPMKMTKKEMLATLDRTSRAAVEKCWTAGSPKEVAAKLQDYIDAGCDLIAPYDLLPAGLGSLDEMASSFQNQVELCRILKQNNPGLATA